ncbi:MAG: hypothetical protein RSA55_03710 [Clostridia bacterium]
MKLVCYAPLRFHGYNVLQYEKNCKPFLHNSPQNFIGNCHNSQGNAKNEFKYSTYEEDMSFADVQKKPDLALLKKQRKSGSKNGAGYEALLEE